MLETEGISASFALIGAIAVVTVVGAAVSAVETRRRKRRIEAAFAGRPSLSPTQFHEAYFQQQGIPPNIVVDVLTILEQQFSVDLSRLADTDDFSRNLNFLWAIDSLADIEIVCALEKRFGIEIEDIEAEEAHTVADIVNLVHRKLGPPCRSFPQTNAAK